MDLPQPLDHAALVSLDGDWYAEGYQRSDGTRYALSGLRPLTGQVRGRLAFGPVLLQAGYGLAPSPVQRTDTQELFQRHQHSFEGGLAYRLATDRWAFAIGPHARYDLFVAYSTPGSRGSDFLDAHFTRLGLGVGSRLAAHFPWGVGEGGVRFYPYFQGTGVLGWHYGVDGDLAYFYPAAGMLWGVGYRFQAFGGNDINQLAHGLSLSLRFPGAR